MFLSELSIFFVYLWGFKKRLKPDLTDARKEMPFKVAIIPVVFDFLATPLSYLSLSLIPASIY